AGSDPTRVEKSERRINPGSMCLTVARPERCWTYIPPVNRQVRFLFIFTAVTGAAVAKTITVISYQHSPSGGRALRFWNTIYVLMSRSLRSFDKHAPG